MMKNIGSTISEGIKRGKWLEVSYKNYEHQTTYFWLAVIDIDFDKRTLMSHIFNDKKSLDTMDVPIHFDRILSAKILEFSEYDVPDNLYNKIENYYKNNDNKDEWLNYVSFNNNILDYYKKCNVLDSDPYQKSSILIPGIDTSVLIKNHYITLTDEQSKIVIDYIKKYDLRKLEYESSDFAISRLAISMGDKEYVVIYHEIRYNPKNKTLEIDSIPSINQSFLIEGKTYSLTQYINMSPEVFISDIENNPNENIPQYTELIRENLRNGEKINELPEFMILNKRAPVNLANTYNIIEEKMANNELEYPLKAFFGDTNRRHGKRSKEPNIVIFDDKVNIDQMRVIYNTMKYPITYVQGPPGTGKTQTIINVILTNFLSEKSLLICSSNNKPINNIVEKLSFGYDADEESPIPYLRLGNRDVVLQATKRIKKLFEFEYNENITDDIIDELKRVTDKSNEELIKKLSIYEQRQEIEMKMESLHKLYLGFGEMDNNNKIYHNTVVEFNRLKKELDSLPTVSNNDVLELVSSVKDNDNFKLLIFYLSVKCIKKLKQPRYKELYKIVNMDKNDDKVTEFNKWCSSDYNIKLLEDAFPIIITTNISSERLGTAYHTFDLLIMDEAGQCNVATALLAIARTKKLLLVGDSNQLKPVILLEDVINKKLRNEFKISDDYDYTNHSILDIMRGHDKISKDILLKYHYRCGRKIIDFSNQRFYDSELNLDYLKDEGKLELIDVKNINSNNRNEQFEEASAIIDYIIRNNIKDAAIITPFVNQQQLINKMLINNNIKDITCGTVHQMQGGEKETVIISTSLSAKTSRKTYEWLKNNAEITNVAVTRAKKNLIVVNDNEALMALANGEDSDLTELVKYITSNGTISVPLNENYKKIEFGLSNGSTSEDEFYKTITQFCSINKEFRVERNVKISTIFPNDPVLSKSKLEFDVVLYKNDSLIPSIVIELNGGEHLGNLDREKCDARKMEICKERNIQLIIIPNSYSKSYETIKNLLLDSCNEEREQLELF